MSTSCAKRTTKQECEVSGIMARFMNCKWHSTFGCGNAKSLVPKDTATLRSKTSIKPPQLATHRATPPTSPTTPHDPIDCEVPACQSKTSAFARLVRTPHKTTNDHSQDTAQATTEFTPAAFAQTGQCPVGREDLGWQSWTLLHSVAAYYPDAPSKEDRTRAHQFVEALGHLYPCTHCAEAFREDMKEIPVRLESRKSFSIWMCRMHNRVNSKLGKTSFPCTIDLLDARWRRNKACEIDDGNNASETLGQDKT